MDGERLRALSGLRPRSLPRLLGALVRHPQGAPGRQLRQPRAAAAQHLAQLLYARPLRRLRRIPHVPGALKRIESRDNAQVKALVKLASSAAERRRTGTTLIEGERLVGAYRDSGATAELLAVGESAYARPEMRSLVDAAPARVKLLLSDRVVDKISQVVTASGLVAVVKAPRPPDVPKQIGNAILIENLQDPGNLGSILRSA